jgi:DNA-binding IclR family transcriptional regulator
MTESGNSSAAALRAVAIMEIVARSERPVPLSEIVEHSGLPPPTAFRILSMLEAAGLVQREPTGKTYGVGHRLARFGLDVMTNNSVRAERRVILRRLVDEIGETCNLAMFGGDEIVYIDRIETDWSLKADLKPGSRVPLHCTSSGKLFLSQMPKAQAAALPRLAELQALHRQHHHRHPHHRGATGAHRPHPGRRQQRGTPGRGDRHRGAGERWQGPHDRQRRPAGPGGAPAARPAPLSTCPSCSAPRPTWRIPSRTARTKETQSRAGSNEIT